MVRQANVKLQQSRASIKRKLERAAACRQTGATDSTVANAVVAAACVIIDCTR
jgi:uncharacterized protein (DUF1778 family)